MKESVNIELNQDNLAYIIYGGFLLHRVVCQLCKRILVRILFYSTVIQITEK